MAGSSAPRNLATKMLAGLLFLLVPACAHDESPSGAVTAPVVAAAPSQAQQDAAAVEARYAAQTLGKALVGALTTQLSTGTPATAVGFCNEKASGIAADLVSRTGVDIRRTSQRVRNPANAPDAWESEQLASLAADMAAGMAPDTLERRLLVQGKDGWRLRVMKPIVMQPMCTTCHGTSVESGLQEVIHGLYPQDQATGFSAGELRGAFSASVPIR